MEEWRDIEGYEGLYQVSNEGRVRSLKYGKIKVLKSGKVTSGHLQVHLRNNGNAIHFMAHRLVAKAFIPNPNGKDVVHHKDHNTNNNRVENLEWMTKKEHDAMHVGEKKKTVYQYTLDDVLVTVYPSAGEAAKQLGLNHPHITDCCNGKRKTHMGYKWSYKPL